MGNCVKSNEQQDRNVESIGRKSWADSTIFSKLKNTAIHNISKKQELITLNQKRFVNELKKPEKDRNIHMEISILQQNILAHARVQFYRYISSLCNNLCSDKTAFQEANKHTHLYPKVKAIMDLSELVDPDFKNQASSLYMKYPQAKKAQVVYPDKIEQKQIFKHFSKTLKPTPQMLNEYMLNLSSREIISLQNLKKSGHKVSYQ